MSELLKRRYDVVVLKTELRDVARNAPDALDVHFTLQCTCKGVLKEVLSWSANTGVMGLREIFDTHRIAAGAESQIRLPEDLLAELASWFSEQTEGEPPLWVHLVEPYGALRFVPWERLLGNALQRPILMLPDFLFSPPREASLTLHVALCASAPLGSEERSIYEGVRLTARRILEGSPRRTRLHVFVDAQFSDSLRVEWQTAGLLDTEIFVYDNEFAKPYVAEDPSSRQLDQAGLLRSPWLLWMREALRKQAVDVVHFCCHGYLSRGRGALLFAQSPLDRSDRYLAGPVGMVELRTFLTQVGAWSSAFSSVPDNFSEPGLRALADELAQSRPGPVLMHNLGIDPGADALAAGYHFLFAKTPQPVPRSTALLMYCQPDFCAEAASVPSPRTFSRIEDLNVELDDIDSNWKDVATEIGSERAQFHKLLARNVPQLRQSVRSYDASALDPLFDREQNVAPLIATTERYAEQVQLNYQEMARDGLLPQDSESHQTQLTMDMLERLRAAVAEVPAPDELLRQHRNSTGEPANNHWDDISPKIAAADGGTS